MNDNNKHEKMLIGVNKKKSNRIACAQLKEQRVQFV